MSTFRLIFFTRRGCHLCEEAKPLIVEVAGELGLGLEEIDIDSDPDLVAGYSHRVPVLATQDGVVLAEGVITGKRRLRRRLRRML